MNASPYPVTDARPISFLFINYELILTRTEVSRKGEFLLKLKYRKICSAIWFRVTLFCFWELVSKERHCFLDWISLWSNICKNTIGRNNYNVITLKDNIIYSHKKHYNPWITNHGLFSRIKKSVILKMKMSFRFFFPSSLNFARFINQLTIYYTPYLWNSFVFIRLKWQFTSMEWRLHESQMITTTTQQNLHMAFLKPTTATKQGKIQGIGTE